MRTSLAAVAVAMIALGCSSSNSATGPDPRNCTKGTISFPQTVTAKMDASACTLYDYWYLADSTNYWSYDVHLDSGGAYLINLAAANDTAHWDAVMELVGRDENTGDEQLLLISDDEGARWGSQLYFVAPKSGTFSVRAMNYDFGDTATYALTTRTCAKGLTQITDSVIGSAQSIASTDCWLESPLFTYDSVQMKLYTIWMAPGHEKEITVSSGVMQPGFQVFGPGFGESCDYGFNGCGGGVAYSNDDDVVSGSSFGSTAKISRGSLGSTVSLSIDSYGGYNCYYYCIPIDWAGQYTLAVGPGMPSEGPDFTLTVQDITGEESGARVANTFLPNLYDIKLEHLTKKPKHTPASFARKVTYSKF